MRKGLGVLVVCLAGCATVPPAAEPGLPDSPKPVVIVADGAGDFRACSGTLRSTAAADGLNLEVVTFVWSHGYLRNVADQTDSNHARNRGEMLAELVRWHLGRFPGTPVTLLGHSAGCAVVLSAAEQLPGGSLDRLVLLSPSISEGYDVAPALMATREGIDVFVSDKDWVWLGLMVRILGTTDNPLAARAAGRFGFAVPAEGDIANKVRMHRWSPDEQALGHDGGHFGFYQPGYVREKLFPLIRK